MTGTDLLSILRTEVKHICRAGVADPLRAAELIRRAADEIERLRAELDHSRRATS